MKTIKPLHNDVVPPDSSPLTSEQKARNQRAAALQTERLAIHPEETRAYLQTMADTAAKDVVVVLVGSFALILLVGLVIPMTGSGQLLEWWFTALFIILPIIAFLILYFIVRAARFYLKLWHYKKSRAAEGVQIPPAQKR